MASSSSASTPSWKYDVFLSFRGEDTRNNFTDHLHEGLRRYGIKTFIDDRLRRGEQISPALLQAIEDSRFSILIFSQNYASSSWCLDELTKILECVDKGEHKAFPVFYEVDPAHVRHQRGSYEEAFKNHEEAYKDNMEKVVKWRQALTTASGYAGWDTRDRHQSKVIREIVSKIFNKVPVNPSASNKIGMESRIGALLSLLCIGFHDVRMVGIWGMAGIGKTTLAEAIYQRIHTQFEGSCFLSNVRERSQTIDNLQMELLSKILHEENLDIRNFNMGSDSIRKALHSKQVLIVLDDVNHVKQLDELVGNRDWFGPKSRMIITTRDKRLLIENDVDTIYEVEELERDEALMLFCQHAFKDMPLVEDFEDLCDRSLDYTKGNPLAIKILGSLLFKRTKKEWDCELEKLKKFPNKDVQEVLSISFDGLEDTVKDIFLDITCFFKGRDKDYVSELLKCCDFYPETGIRTLVERALVIVSNDNRLCMHDLIQEMGWEIVRQQSTEFPGKRSRLWLKEDVQDVSATNSGTETIQGMIIDLSASKELLDINVDVFTKMIKLRVLEFRIFDKWQYDFGGRQSSTSQKIHLIGDFQFLSNNLRYLWWEGYPLKSLPSNFYPRKLFELNMCFSRLEKLWEGRKAFRNLWYMDLSHSRDLIRTPDLSEAPELRKIYLQGCTSLVEVHSSIETLKKLSFLNLRYCSKLEKVAESFCKLTSLESVDFSSCSKLRKLPDDLRMSSPYLVLSGCSNLEQLPKRIGELTSLKTPDLCSKLKKWPGNRGKPLVSLNLVGCSKLKELPNSIGELTSLRTLNLSRCSKLEKLPKSIGELTCLETLDLSFCSELKKLPSLNRLTRVSELRLKGCKSLRALTELPASIEAVWASYCESLETFSHSYSMSKSSGLKLDFSYCGRLLENEESLEALLGGIRMVSPIWRGQSFGTVAAGRTVPAWFIHWSEGNSIIVKLPPRFHNLNDVALGFCVVLDENLSPWNTDHLWFGCESARMISDKMLLNRVSHLKFSFHLLGREENSHWTPLGWEKNSLWNLHRREENSLWNRPEMKTPLVLNEEYPLVVKECGIRLLYSPVQSEENRNRLLRSGGNIERETVRATVFSPPPTLNFDEEHCWKTIITAENPAPSDSLTGVKRGYYSNQGWFARLVEKGYYWIHPSCATTSDEKRLASLTLRIEVEGSNIYVPDIKATSPT